MVVPGPGTGYVRRRSRFPGEDAAVTPLWSSMAGGGSRPLVGHANNSSTPGQRATAWRSTARLPRALIHSCPHDAGKRSRRCSARLAPDFLEYGHPNISLRADQSRAPDHQRERGGSPYLTGGAPRIRTCRCARACPQGTKSPRTDARTSAGRGADSSGGGGTSGPWDAPGSPNSPRRGSRD
jgi:hypothetical protein